MVDGRVLYADADNVQVLRYVGTVRLPLAPTVNAFLAARPCDRENRRVVIDLSQTEAIDSTNLGEIARIADLLGQHPTHRAMIISTRPEISETLRTMAFHEFFDICSQPLSCQPGEPLPGECVPQQAQAELIVSAHRKLMEMSQNNRILFADVVALMEQDLNAKANDGHEFRSIPAGKS